MDPRTLLGRLVQSLTAHDQLLKNFILLVLLYESRAFGEMIKTYIKEGTIVPMEVTIQLLENAMKATMEQEKDKTMFLIDGTASINTGDFRS